MFETIFTLIIQFLAMLFGGLVVAIILTLFVGEAWTQW